MQMNERLVLTRVWVEPKPLGQKPSLFVVDEAVSLFRAVGAAKPGLDLIRALATLAAVMLNPGKICPHILKGYACRLFHCHREVSLVSKLKASRLLVARVASAKEAVPSFVHARRYTEQLGKEAVEATWVVVKIRVPFWYPEYEEKGTIILTTTHMLQIYQAC